LPPLRELTAKAIEVIVTLRENYKTIALRYLEENWFFITDDKREREKERKKKVHDKG
jgi:predicted transcriptional regulator